MGIIGNYIMWYCDIVLKYKKRPQICFLTEKKKKNNFFDKSYIPTRSIYLQKLTLILTLQMNRYSSIRCPTRKNYSCWWLQMIKQMTASKCWFEYWIYFFATNFVWSFSFQRNGSIYSHSAAFICSRMTSLTSYSISVQCCISYRNQPFVLQSKTNDWFLYETQH